MLLIPARTYRNLLQLLLYIAGALLLLMPALYNGFPLVTSDSGAYVMTAHKMYAPLDRPLTYSIFIRVFSLGFSFWCVIFVQAFLLFALIKKVVDNVLGTYSTPAMVIAITVLLTAFTGAGLYASQLMPDIFAALALLTIVCWFCFEHTPREGVFYLVLLFLLAVQHNSISLILFLFSGGVILFSVFVQKSAALVRKSLLVMGVSFSSLLLFSCINLIDHRGFRPSPATNIFLMCRFVETGIMDKFLAENCSNNEYNLCAYKNNLPNRQWEFMWNEDSPLYKTGGWEANEKEYGRVVKKIMTTPKYLGLFIFKSLQAGARQLFQFGLGDGITNQGPGSSPYNNIAEYQRNELKEYASSMQNTGGLPFNMFMIINFLFFVLVGVGSLLIRGYSGPGSSSRNNWGLLFAVVIFFIVCNAFVTATFSTVVGRFNTRVSFVLCFMCLLYILSHVHIYLNMKKAN